MKALFSGQDVWEIIQHGYADPADMAAYNNLTQAEKYVLREQRKKDGNLCFSYIKLCMRADSQE